MIPSFTTIDYIYWSQFKNKSVLVNYNIFYIMENFWSSKWGSAKAVVKFCQLCKELFVESWMWFLGMVRCGGKTRPYFSWVLMFWLEFDQVIADILLCHGRLSLQVKSLKKPGVNVSELCGLGGNCVKFKNACPV